MLVPSLILIILLSYIPMSGIVVAFKNFKYNEGIFGSRWCGFDNFKFFFKSGTGWLITKNTLVYNLRNLLVSQAVSIVAAIFISELTGKIFKKLVQSAIFFPYFISWIIVGAIAYNIFNYDTGTLNSLLTTLGMEKINVYGMPGIWKWIILIVNCWKWIGYNSVIYIAAIMGLDNSCYESAAIDGANIFQRIWYITLPGIRPTIVTILLLQVGRILRGDFQMFYQLIGNNGQLYNATDVIDTYAFRALASGGDLGMTSAATVYQSVLCFIIIMVVNAVVKRIEADYALF